MSSLERSTENPSELTKTLSGRGNETHLDNGFSDPKNAVISPKKINRSISESIQHKNRDTLNKIPDTMNIHLQTAGQGIPNEVDCIGESVGKDSSSIQYECKYQHSSGSPKKSSCKNVRKIGLDGTDELDVNFTRDEFVEECIQGTKRMVIENLPAARIHGKFSLNLPYVFDFIF